MAKVEIEVPNGKVAEVTKDGDKGVVSFKEVSLLDRLKDIEAVKEYIFNLAGSGCVWALGLVAEYQAALGGSYSEKICLYRMVVAALTNNEERHLTTGEQWFPVVQFCKPGKEKNCYGNKVVGTIESEGQRFTVVGGRASDGALSGLGLFHSDTGVSTSYTGVGFRSVSRREIAEHISKYFGRLLFEIHYGGVNCEWKWIN